VSIETRAFARAGLIGNPSDGYYGKTIAFLVRNFHATVALEESDRLQVVPSEDDHVNFDSLEELAADVDRHGYYGGIRLVKATIKKFHEYCRAQSISLDDRNFSIAYRTNIPRAVGLAGSSAIVCASMRGLMEFYGVEIPKEMLPTLVLRVETEELEIPAGFQDRVIQVYGGMVYMDFSRELVTDEGHGRYEEMDTSLLRNVYVAYDPTHAECTEVRHSRLKARFEQGDPDVLAAMQDFARYTDEAKASLENGDLPALGRLLDANYDRRKSICHLNPRHERMVETARARGASAKFAGSGGAIVGTYEDDSMFAALSENLGSMGIEVIRPEIGGAS
jgi:glucuronokinase